MIPFAAALFLAGTPAQAHSAPPQPSAAETVILFAANGGLREWQRGEARDLVYVRDRNERWYRVRLSAPLNLNLPIDGLSYTTDPDGRFDRFQRVRFLRQPEVSYGVLSITSAPPPPQRRGTEAPPAR